MPMQPATLFTICAVQTVLCTDTRQDLYSLYILRTVFEVTRCLKYHGDLPLSIYFDAEMNREIALPDFNHGCDELFDWAGEIMENILHFNDWSSPDILPRHVYAYLMSRTTVYRHFFREESAHVVMKTKDKNLNLPANLCQEIRQRCRYIDPKTKRYTRFLDDGSFGIVPRGKRGVFKAEPETEEINNPNIPIQRVKPIVSLSEHLNETSLSSDSEDTDPSWFPEIRRGSPRGRRGVIRGRPREQEKEIQMMKCIL
ncbi:hypothetical protein AVEN_39720-1 [Araneus ventricosus]|uniref:Uncharacterized protein n=1 Tax=Araneus ventricosus TaxID=182803 RepID=A0A4Y2LVH1_ARAVE|nr:hypothetical protein AVEN_39720-1 [Araneus ventricosus]